MDEQYRLRPAPTILRDRLARATGGRRRALEDDQMIDRPALEQRGQAAGDPAHPVVELHACRRAALVGRAETPLCEIRRACLPRDDEHLAGLLRQQLLHQARRHALPAP